MTVTVQRDRYDEAICRKCGHKASGHGTDFCRFLVFSKGFEYPDARVPCNCSGWDRDPHWPPPIIVRDAA